MAPRAGLVVWMVSSLLAGCAGEDPPSTKTETPNEAPTIELVEPLDGEAFFWGEAIRFSATVDDDADLSGLELEWDSDQDGLLGTGTADRAVVTFQADELSLGDHTVTVVATDAGGLSASDTVQISVVDAELSLEVDSIIDAVDANPGDRLCDDGSGQCTLRAAVMEANAWIGATTIRFAASVTPGTFALTLHGFGEDDGLTGDLDIDAELTIVGAGADQTIIDGGGLDRVLHIQGPGVVSLSGVTIQNGESDATRGGGILNEGDLTIDASTLRDNGATGYHDDEGGGGGLCNEGTVMLTDSTISGNVAREAGGGLCNISHAGLGAPSMTLLRCTVSGNQALDGIGDGGGLASYEGSVTITNSTISGNRSQGEGGGLYNLNASEILVSSSTISGNRNTEGFGNAIRNFGTVEVRGSILSSDAPGDGCSGDAPVESLGYNIDSDGTCGLTAAGDLPSVDALLEPLQDNGGATETHALQPGSPALDAIPETECTDAQGQPVTTDQRETSRPQGAGCDIGAFEAP